MFLGFVTNGFVNIRFHAWQSSLLFTFLFIVHIIFSWSSFLSWVIFIGDVGLIGWLTFKAYVDGKILFSITHIISHSPQLCISTSDEYLKTYADLVVIAATLDRYEVPFFGAIASKILDDE
jgi:uncharacterized membrane protein